MATIASTGYRLIYVGKDHHLADVRGYAYEHRLVAEKKIGRKLRPKEQVHHLDHDKLNNDPDNLDVAKTIKHHRLHHRKNDIGLRMPDEENIIVSCECGCGDTFYKYDQKGRPRKYISGHNPQQRSAHDFLIKEIAQGNNTTKGLMKKYQSTGIKTVLSRMVKDGYIIRVSTGVYKIK